MDLWPTVESEEQSIIYCSCAGGENTHYFVKAVCHCLGSQIPFYWFHSSWSSRLILILFSECVNVRRARSHGG